MKLRYLLALLLSGTAFAQTPSDKTCGNPQQSSYAYGIHFYICVNGSPQQVDGPGGGNSSNNSANIYYTNTPVQADSVVSTPANGLQTFGDSITLAAGYNPYPTIIGADIGATVTNNAVSGDVAGDMAFHVLSTLNPGDENNPIVTSMIGTNDQQLSGIGAVPTFVQYQYASAGWAALSSTNKILTSIGGVTKTGTWSSDTTFANAHGETSSTAGDTLSYSGVIGPSNVFYVFYKMSSTAGTFQVLDTATPIINTVNGSIIVNTDWTGDPPQHNTSSFGMARFVVSQGTHTIVPKVLSGTVTILAFGFPPSTRYRGLSFPRYIVGGVPVQAGNINVATLSALNQASLSVSAALVGDGLYTPFADIFNALDYNLDFSSGTVQNCTASISLPLHPNQCGQQLLAGRFESVINAAPGGSGGGGTTCPTTTDLLAGNGTAGGCVDSTIAPANVALLNAANVFTAAQTVNIASGSAANPEWVVGNTSGASATGLGWLGGSQGVLISAGVGMLAWDHGNGHFLIPSTSNWGWNTQDNVTAGGPDIWLYRSGTNKVRYSTAANGSANGTVELGTLLATGAVSSGATPPTACGTATGCFALNDSSGPGTPTAGQSYIYVPASTGLPTGSFNGGAEIGLATLGPNAFTGTQSIVSSTTGHVVTVENTNSSNYSDMVFLDSTGTLKGQIGYGNSGAANYNGNVFWNVVSGTSLQIGANNSPYFGVHNGAAYFPQFSTSGVICTNDGFGTVILCPNAGAGPSVATAISTPNGTPTYTPGTSVTSCVQTTGYTNTNQRGSITIVGGTATTGTICTINFSGTLSAAPGFVQMTQNGGTTVFDVGHGIPSTAATTVTAGISVIGATVIIDYNFLP